MHSLLCPHCIAVAVAFLASMFGWAVMWFRGKRFERKLKKHDEKCCCRAHDKKSEEQS